MEETQHEVSVKEIVGSVADTFRKKSFRRVKRMLRLVVEAIDAEIRIAVCTLLF